MNETTSGRWVRLRDGGRFFGELYAGFDGRQRGEILISALWSGKVPMRARMTAKPRKPDLQPVWPILERNGVLGTTTQLPGIEGLLLRADPRTLSWDIPADRIVIFAFIANDEKGLWAPFFPGWLTTAEGRIIVIEMDDIEFDGAAARAYAVENLLPAAAIPSDEAAPGPESNRFSARRPSREKPFWSTAREAAFEWLTENGCPAPRDGEQAKLEKHVTGWLTKHGYEAGEASVRRHVKRWIEEQRAELNAA